MLSASFSGPSGTNEYWKRQAQHFLAKGPWVWFEELGHNEKIAIMAEVKTARTAKSESGPKR